MKASPMPEGSLPQVVVIGGGTGLSVMLRGLKQHPVAITAIVTVADDGGSSGRLRSELAMVPPGDIRNVMTALADKESLLGQVLEYRFQRGEGLAGHSLGNLILAAMQDIAGDFVSGVRELSRVLAVRGRVLPAADQAIVLRAEMSDGTMVVGESKIPQVRGRIRRVLIDPPDVCALPEAVEAIKQADAIVIGPGSLYTSILPNLLVPQIAETILQSKAIKIFVCNVMTQPGETDDYTVCDHLDAVHAHIGSKLADYVIVNNGLVPKSVQKKYADKGAKLVRLDEREVKSLGYRIIADDLVQFETYLRHDAGKLSFHIYRLVKGWLS